MPVLKLETLIAAPPDVCFDLMRDVRIHTETTPQTHEKAVGGVTEGKMEFGQTVTFEGTHLGLRQRLTVKVVEFERPRLFVDEMVEGAFREFRHIHEFVTQDGATLMKDTLIWASPLGILGRVADRLFIEPHLRSLVTKRNQGLKQLAEHTTR
jgi:ligand-binding SRPBCC domain-containing protein